MSFQLHLRLDRGALEQMDPVRRVEVVEVTALGQSFRIRSGAQGNDYGLSPFEGRALVHAVMASPFRGAVKIVSLSQSGRVVLSPTLDRLLALAEAEQREEADRRDRNLALAARAERGRLRSEAEAAVADLERQLAAAREALALLVASQAAEVAAEERAKARAAAEAKAVAHEVDSPGAQQTPRPSNRRVARV